MEIKSRILILIFIESLLNGRVLSNAQPYFDGTNRDDNFHLYSQGISDGSSPAIDPNNGDPSSIVNNESSSFPAHGSAEFNYDSGLTTNQDGENKPVTGKLGFRFGMYDNEGVFKLGNVGNLVDSAVGEEAAWSGEFEGYKFDEADLLDVIGYYDLDGESISNFGDVISSAGNALGKTADSVVDEVSNRIKILVDNQIPRFAKNVSSRFRGIFGDGGDKSTTTSRLTLPDEDLNGKENSMISVYNSNNSNIIYLKLPQDSNDDTTTKVVDDDKGLGRSGIDFGSLSGYQENNFNGLEGAPVLDLNEPLDDRYDLPGVGLYVDELDTGVGEVDYRVRRRRSVKYAGTSGQNNVPRHFSSKTLVGSPYETKDQAAFLTSSSHKSNGYNSRPLSLVVNQHEG